ncbi:unnamed protein product [Pseudo-nitzschia multistriata]|uniref:Uncharacterized protein n=1 Tax=Pseudo-nitzschia multistriata TaxID=183589 RepID=A0A448YYW3_9STRA|nr:unnamed protein product [Pseudo-nitzschia multistriata]
MARATKAQRQQVEERRNTVEHPKGLGERPELRIVCLLRIVRAYLSDFVPRSQPFFYGVPLVHDPRRRRFETEEVGKNAHQNHDQGIGGGGLLPPRTRQGAARGDCDEDGHRGEHKVGGKEPGLEPPKGVSREGLEHDDPRNEADPHAAPEPGGKRQQVEEDEPVSAAGRVRSRGEPGAAGQHGDQCHRANHLLGSGGCGCGCVGHDCWREVVRVLGTDGRVGMGREAGNGFEKPAGKARCEVFVVPDPSVRVFSLRRETRGRSFEVYREEFWILDSRRMDSMISDSVSMPNENKDYFSTVTVSMVVRYY